MSSSAINAQLFQAKIGSIQNQADSSSVYSNGVWSFKNSTALTSVTITDAGNVGIGTASPLNALDLRRGAGAGATLSLSGGGRSAGTTSFDVQQASNGEAYLWNRENAIIYFGTNNTERMRIDASGILSSLPTYNNGSASAANMVVNSSGTFLRSVSALKYKQDIRDLESININNFRPVRYKSKCVGDNQTTDHFGIIADEVDAVGIKELVSYGVDGEIEGFQYDRLSVVLVKAIQEQQAQIEALKAEVAALKAP